MVSVFANGIWKSGNNLLMKLCDKIGIPVTGFGVASSSILGQGFFFRKMIRGFGYSKRSVSVGLDASVVVSEKWLEKKLTTLSGSCVGGHSAYSDSLLRLLVRENYKPIQIVRDPRDIIVSFAHWIIKRPDYYAHKAFSNMSLEERMLNLITGFESKDFYHESFATVLDRSFGWITRPENVLVIRFEDLVGEHGGGTIESQHRAISDVLKWIGCDVVETNSIATELFGDTPTFRKGKIGGWEDEFTPAVNDAFSYYISDRATHWGY